MRQRGFSRTAGDNIVLHRSDGPQIVTVSPSDAGFRVYSECGTWTQTPTTGPQVTSFGAGAWIVGADIAPGLYRLDGAPGCEWSTYQRFGLPRNEQIRAEDATGIQTVAVLPSVAGLWTNQACGTWSLVPADGPQVTTFEPGTFVVGTDIAPGAYQSTGAVSTGQGTVSCFWQRLNGFEGLLSNVTETDAAAGPTTVLIADDDAGFASSAGCGTWIPRDLTTFGPGRWLIGQDILPGTYRNSGEAECSWWRLGPTGENIGSRSSTGVHTVTVAASDTSFQSRDACGLWSLAPTTGPQATTFGPGTWIVGIDIAPGLYRSSSNTECGRWRLGGFGGTSDEASGGRISVGTHTINVAASDAGFRSLSGCGTWTVAPTSGPQVTTFAIGEWIVGVDIAPGTYRSNGTGECR